MIHHTHTVLLSTSQGVGDLEGGVGDTDKESITEDTSCMHRGILVGESPHIRIISSARI